VGGHVVRREGQAFLIKSWLHRRTHPIYWSRDVSDQPYGNRLSKRVSTVTVVVTGVGLG
jgi:hypothetical protein